MRATSFLLLLLAFDLGQARPEDDPVLRGREMSLQGFAKIVLPPPIVGEAFPGLNSNSPEVLHREAERLQLIADNSRRLAIEFFLSEFSLGQSRQARIIKMALEALTTSGLFESRVILPKWVAWWSKSNKPVPYDTRLDADRFMAYAIERLHGRLVDTSDILELEKDLDSLYVDELLRNGSSIG